MLLGSDGSANPVPLDAGDSTFPTSIRMPDSIWHHVDVLDRGADVKGRWDGDLDVLCSGATSIELLPGGSALKNSITVADKALR